MDMEEFDISRISLIIVNIIFNVMIGILRNIIVYYILYGISISQSAFYPSPIFSNSLAKQMLYNLDSTFQIIYILLGVILPAFVIAGLMTKLSDSWNYFEENPSKAEEFALYFLIGLIVQLITLIAG
ncbi:MAG: hypothetical protein RRA45_10325 [Saccharolobus sp.]|uniref:hypothetical protein n=1 Tax=Saccharolobus sp. TaxID=2100761 RepID=UPI0028CE5D64|nr:hypothetical protein [Saccharolobus sp.]MDT7862592.1 hypothetical protein [Saccharolobus sp.]